MTIPERVQRLLWGRTRAEAALRARIEVREREIREARREGRCFIAHAPEIWGGYCEVHKWPVTDGNRLTCEKGRP